ncbi:MAG: alcohol dehydrogenase catalytic domain-containing protein, partial [Anaerolineales bacterium]|nr:alcohol dehydrogenase catalytic domain-containing protein [Anaerolineales bacterium]
MRTIYVEKSLPRMLLVKALRPLWPGVALSPLAPAQLRTLPDPPLPGPRWVRVRNRLSGICGTDLALLFVRADLGVAPAALPGTDRMYLGHEALGEVVEVGPGVTRLRVGERVIIDAEAANCFTREISPPC